MKVEILRSEGLQTYEVPVISETMTVMDILDYIYNNLDHTLAYFKHSTCNQAICGRCLVRLDGKPVLACGVIVDSKAELINISPSSNNVIKDLVTSRE